MNSVLRVENISKSFRDYGREYKRVLSWFGVSVKIKEEHEVLKPLSFAISAGEAIGVVGKNGAGKSTLLKIITGTLKPTTGNVIVHGKIGAMLELGMGFSPDLTGRQNAYHSTGLMGYKREQIDKVIDEIEAFADINEYFDQPVRIYSSGMQARVAFAVATAFRPDILIVDEVLSVGDALFQAKCYERIAAFKKQGTVLFLVTHSMNDIVKHCTRALFIKNGCLELDGSPKDVSNRYMDELFGKNNKMIDTSTVDVSQKVSIEKMAGMEDVFYTRPGYRKEEHRWGHGGAVILDYFISSGEQEYPPNIQSNALTKFSFKVIFENNYDDLTIGFLIKTHDGVFLYGTNSFLASEGKVSFSTSIGEAYIFTFSLPMHLNSGHYLISLGVSTGSQENLIPLERRYDSILINIEKTINFWGIVDMQAKFEMEKLT